MLFENLAWFTDLHLGKSNNSPVHLNDCEKFVDWFIQEAKSRNCDLFIMGGDFFDNRNNIGLITLNVAMNILEKINNSFSKSFFLKGNHDLVFRTNRENSSLIVTKNFKNIELINDPTIIDECVFLPWLVDDEYKKVSKLKGKYCFGHLELPNFFMNSRVILNALPNSIKSEDMKIFDYVFTGHFHNRQNLNNIIYTGNTFPFDYSDVNDVAKGAMFLKWGDKPDFISWHDQPLFKTFKLSEMIDYPDQFLCKNLSCKVFLDADITYEESSLIKDTFIDKYGIRKMELVPMPKPNLEIDTNIDHLKFQSIDQIVIESLNEIESKDLEIQKLIDIYKELPN